MSVRPEGFFSYYGVAELDTYDRRFYPSRGISFGGRLLVVHG